MPRLPICTFATLLLGAAALASAAPAAGQIVRGTVRDRASGEAVEEAVVTLFDLDGSARARFLTDPRGRFVLRAPGPGAYYLASQRLGYETTQTDTVALSKDQELDVLLLVDTRPVELEGLETTATRKMVVDSWLVADFYRRVASGRGRYVTRPEIEQRAPGSLTDLLATVPGVAIRRTGLGSNGLAITVRRVRLPANFEAYTTADTTREGDRREDVRVLECPPVIYLDGAPQLSMNGMVNFIDPVEIEGVEIYRSRLETPPQYSHPRAHCGAILIWTRRAR
ncbi:MAG: TonB-dependent receptor [Gemmatimonadota bacterium]